MSIFNIDYDRLTKLLLPIRLRGAITVAYFKVAISGVEYNYGLFQGARAAHLYELNHTGQVCSLEGALNDRFDNSLRRVYIIDGLVILPLYVYRRVEAKLVYLRKRSESTGIKFLRKRGELSMGGTFIIKVPSALSFDANEMRALTNKYKLAGKAYTIQTF